MLCAYLLCHDVGLWFCIRLAYCCGKPHSPCLLHRIWLLCPSLLQLCCHAQSNASFLTCAPILKTELEIYFAPFFCLLIVHSCAPMLAILWMLDCFIFAFLKLCKCLSHHEQCFEILPVESTATDCLLAGLNFLQFTDSLYPSLLLGDLLSSKFENIVPNRNSNLCPSCWYAGSYAYWRYTVAVIITPHGCCGTHALSL